MDSVQGLAGEDVAAEVSKSDGVNADGTSAGDLDRLAGKGRPPEDNKITEADFKPTVEGRPETAPIYDGVRRVVDFPQIVGCLASDDDCKCYTQ